MNKRKVLAGIFAVLGLVIATILLAGLGMLGRFPWQGGDRYEDPQGRFSMDTGRWEQVETDGSYAQFRLAEPPLHLYVLVLEAGTIEDAFSQAFDAVGFDRGLLSGGNSVNIGDWQAYSKEDSGGLSYGLAGQIVGGNAYVSVVKADVPGVGPDNAAVMRVIGSLKIAGKAENKVESYEALEAMVEERVDSLAGSVSVAMLHRGEVVYTYTYGEADPITGRAADARTIYAFGSMTKPFTATALMQLVEQGRVELDARAGDYIPEFPQQWNVTVRQLLNHSACMPDPQRLTDGQFALAGESFTPYREIFTAYIQENPDLLCEPGSTSQYANTHYLALARIIEEVSGEPFESYVIDHILTPLSMQSTQFELVEAQERYARPQYPAGQTAELIARLNEIRGPGQEKVILHTGESFSTLDHARILPPWGGLRGTPEDVTHFLQMYMNEGSYGETQVLQPETVAAMQEMQLTNDGSPMGFGLSWWIGEDDLGEFYYHDGGGKGIENTMRYYPNLDLGVVVMGNVNGYQKSRIAEGLVSAWAHEK